MFQESWAHLSSADEGAGEGELWKVSHEHLSAESGPDILHLHMHHTAGESLG